MMFTPKALNTGCAGCSSSAAGNASNAGNAGNAPAAECGYPLAGFTALLSRIRARALAWPGAGLALLLAGCSGTVEDTIDEYLPKKEPLYKESKRLPPLEIPPDLTSNTLRDSLEVPATGGTTYSEYAQATSQPTSARSSGVLPRFDNVRLERVGNDRWLVVDRPPEDVYADVRDYWVSEGVVIASEEPDAGIIETDWAEQRANLRSGFLSGLFDRISSAAYGPAYRDKFRCRLENGRTPGTTEIFVSHRGAEEVTVQGSAATSLREREDGRRWIPRDSDPELVAEVLARMRVYLGTGGLPEGTQVASDAPAPAKRPDRARMVRDASGTAMLALSDDFPRAWRRTGLALDRVGFTVEDRDRERGVYYVRYVDPEKELGNQDEGFFSKLKFWGDDDEEAVDREYLVSVIDTNNATQVVVLDKDGAPERTGTGDRILGLLHEQLR